MKKNIMMFVIFFCMITTSLFSQSVTLTGTNFFIHSSYGFNGSGMVTSDTGLGAAGTSYRLNLTDNGDGQHFSNVIIGETLSQFYQLATQVRFKYMIPNGYPILRPAMILGSTLLGDTGWCTSPLYTIGSSTWFQTLSPSINPSGMMTTFNQIYLALHAAVPGGGGTQYVMYIDEVEILVNGVWILVDPGTGIYQIPAIPVLNTPVNGFIFTASPQCFNWNMQTGLIYEIQISTDPTFTSIVIDNTNATSPMCVNLPNNFYWWRARVKNSGQPWSGWTPIRSFQVQVTTGIMPINGKIPERFKLEQNYPNPFNPMTKIEYDLPKNAFVSLKIYDITGKEIATLVDEMKNTGKHSVDFNGSDLSSGVYFYKIRAGDFFAVQKMMLMK